MMTESIRNQMYKKIGVLICLLLIAAAATYAHKSKSVDPINDKAHEIKVEEK